MRLLGRGIWRRVGRRGAALLWFGLLDVVYAFSLFYPQPDTVQSPSTRFISDVLPLWAWGVAWLIPGLLCLTLAFSIHRDKFAFAAAMAIKLVWGVLFVAGWVLVGLPRAWLGGVIWLSLAAFVAILSGWPEPITLVIVKRER